MPENQIGAKDAMVSKIYYLPAFVAFRAGQD